MGADVGGAFAEAGGFFDVFEAVELAFEAGEGVEDGEVEVAGVFEEVGAIEEGHAAGLGGEVRVVGGEGGEEEAAAFAEGGEGGLEGGGGDLPGAEEGFGVAGEVVEAGGGEADAEVVAGDVFELVGLVEDDGGRLRGGCRRRGLRRPAA